MMSSAGNKKSVDVDADGSLDHAAKTWEAEVAATATSRGSVDVRNVVAGRPAMGSNGGASAKSQVTLTWHDLRYTVYPNGKKKPSLHVLKGLTGAALPHHVMALMGPTGRVVTQNRCIASVSVSVAGFERTTAESRLHGPYWVSSIEPCF
jgi:hypothetical protein